MAAEPIQATKLAALERQIATSKLPDELLAVATAVDDLGRQLALEIVAAPPELAAPLKPVLLQVPVLYTRTLLRAAETFDDAGSPRRAARVLIEALRKAFDANLVELVVDALAFTLEVFGQQAAVAKARELVTAPPELSRRELRVRHLAVVEELLPLIDWTALDDELGLD